MIRILVEAKADLNRCDRPQSSPIHRVINLGHLSVTTTCEIVTYCLGHGGTGKLASKKLAIIKYLLESRASPNVDSKSKVTMFLAHLIIEICVTIGVPALASACKVGDLEVVRLLLKVDSFTC